MDAVILAALKKHNPHIVIVYEGDESRKVAVPQRRRRWQAVTEAIESRPWTRIVFQNKAGEDLGYLEGEEPEPEPLALVKPGSADPIEQAMRIVGIVMQAQKETLKHRDQELVALLRAYGDQTRELTQGMKVLSSIWQAQVEAATELAETRAAAEGDPDTMRELLEAAPQLLPLIPAIRGMLGGKAS